MKIAINLSRTSRVAAALLVVAACFQQPAAAYTATDCAADGGVASSGNCYVVDETLRSWSGAQAEIVAQSLDPLFHLVSIHDAVENAYVGSLFPSGDSFWIGLTDSSTFSTEGTFVWTDGSPLDYTNWASGQPDNSSAGLDFVRFDNSIDQWLTDVDDSATSAYFSVFSAPLTSAVPVPAAVWLFGSGLIGLAGVARRRRNRPPVNAC